MNNPKVSIIIPVYQVENFLERAVDSALEQTLPETEIILVDDGSEDDSPQICDRYAQLFPERVRVIHQENAGLGMARNAGLEIAAGEYILFMDSDDTIEPTMCEELYDKAVREDDDIVMCDVKIIYVEEGRSSVVSTYPRTQIDPAGYIANGNNITYSVNKLFRRSIWEHNRYRKMLFEDIALIPAIVTQYPRIGYVPKPFYNYYRRPNTLSTAPDGHLADLVDAFSFFLAEGNPRYREETVYCIARQLLWNMTQSRILFQADFITFLKEHQQDFLLNPYLAKDAKTKRILDYLKQDVLPENLICAHFYRPIPEEYLAEVESDFPRARLIDLDEAALPPEGELPESVRAALAGGNTRYAEEYLALKTLYEEGGIVLTPESRASLNLKRLRLQPIFFGFESEEALTTGCFGALKEHYVIGALLDSYAQDNIYSRAHLPLQDRLRDFLIVHFNLKMNGRKQLLRHEIPVFLPDVLAYDMKNGENCCKRADIPVPDGFEAVRDNVLKLWSDRIMENWTLYKQVANQKQPGKPAPVPPPVSGISQDLLTRELDARTREVMDAYENSTSWKITKPLRALSNLFHRRGGKT